MRLGNAPSPGRFYRLLWRHAIDPFVDRFVANSEYTRRELLTHGISQDKVTVISNMPAPRRGPWNPGAPRIPGRVIFVGQIIPEKGLALLLDALAMVRADGVDATLDIVGDMDGWEAPAVRGYRAELRERAGRADLDGAVSFLGWSEEVPELMSRASVHCCPSRPEQREAFGNVVLEAKVSDLPSVVTPSGDLPELVAHRVDGWVCAETTAEAVAEGLGHFLCCPDELARAGRAALASAERFSPERFEAAWQAVFAER
jgi:glycosyltransferase involved in cell wall biosynthesis